MANMRSFANARGKHLGACVAGRTDDTLAVVRHLMERVVTIGSDEVRVEHERLIIHAAEPMDLPIREFCRVPLYFEGREYYLRSKRKGERPYVIVYELWPWPTDLHERSSRQVIYDESYVAERDAQAAERRRHEWLHLALLPFYPLLGLCWSGFKNRVLGRIGFEPSSITRASMILTFNLMVVEAIFVGWLAGGLLTYLIGWSSLRAVDWGLLLLLGADTVMRFGQSLKFDIEHHWGFCEWLWPKR